MELAPSSHDARNKILISINNSQFLPHFLLDFRGEVFSLFLKLKYSQFTLLCWFLWFSFIYIYICIHAHTMYMYVYVYTHTLFQIILHYRLLKYIEYSSLCYTAGPCCISFLYKLICICQPQTPNLSLPTLSPLIAIRLFSMSQNLFCNKFLCIIF